MEHNEAAADEAAAQLAALSALDGILERLGLDYWLFGGWAVDFWVGRITRIHDDIDLAVWLDDYPGIRQALEAAGWRYEPVEDAATGAGFRSGAVLVELTFVASDPTGQVFIPFPEQPGLWSTVPFGTDRRKLQGVSCRTVPLSLLRAGKAVPRDDAEDGAKDRADFLAITHIHDDDVGI